MPSSPSPLSAARRRHHGEDVRPGTSSSSISGGRPVPLQHSGTSSAAPSIDELRRPSIQFATRKHEADQRTGSPKSARYRAQRRISSPPPPAPYQDRVSFDTFDNRDASDFSLTLNSKHKDYQYTRRSRTFLCGTDQNDYSEFALEWLIDELVDDGDEIVCLRVVDKDSKINSDASVEEGRYRREAKKLLDQIIEKNREEEKAISLVLEFAVGKVHDTIQRMIQIYEPAMLIVGTRGRSLGGIQGLLPGSVSKYCLQHSPVPVIVVRPTYKREKKKKKRQADPNRSTYMDILEKSGIKGHALDPTNRDSIVPEAPAANDDEAEAVAAALGLPPNFESGTDMPELSKIQTGKSDATTTRSDATSPDSPSPTEEVLMDDPKSPTMMDNGNQDSPDDSASESSEDEGDGEPRFEAELASGAPEDEAENAAAETVDKVGDEG